MRTADGGDAAGSTAYEIVGTVATFQVNDNNTTTAIEQITARSPLYDVVFTFNVLRSTFLADGGPPLAALKVQEVNAICGVAHVFAVRSTQDLDDAGHLYNYLVVVVGDESGARTTEVQIRMDQIGTPAAFAAIDAAWQTVQNLGPAASPTV